MPALEEWTPASQGSGVGRQCIYKIQTGSLIFRRGAPTSSTEQPHAAYRGDALLSERGDEGDEGDEAQLVAADVRRRSELNGGGRQHAVFAKHRHGTNASKRGMHALCPMPLVDAPRTSAGVAAALASARAMHTFAIRQCGLLPEAAEWTGAFLSAELARLQCHVLAAPASSSRFTYFWGLGADRMHAHYEAPPTVRSIGMGYADFREKVTRRCPAPGAASSDGEALYLQTGLAQRSPSGEMQNAAGVGPELQRMLAKLREAADVGGAQAPDPAAGKGAASNAGPATTTLGREAMAVALDRNAGQEGVRRDAPRSSVDAAVALIRGLVSEGRMGRYSRTAFFASSVGAITRLHFDHYDNLYLQLRGRKRFVILAPLEARGLYAFPLHHPLDQRARVHIDAVEQAAAHAAGDHDPAHVASQAAAYQAAYPRLGDVRGFEIILEPGDMLYIPHHWWHHVETIGGDEGVDRLSLSLNLWFDFEPRLVSPPLPLTQGLLLELARHVEQWIGSLLGEKAIPDFLESCALELSMADAELGASGARARVTADEANAVTLPRQWLVARNLLFCELATAYVGWGELRAFFDELLSAGRYRGLVAVEPEMGASPRAESSK